MTLLHVIATATIHTAQRLCLEKVLYLGKPQDRTFRKSLLVLQSPVVAARGKSLPTLTKISVS